MEERFSFAIKSAQALRGGDINSVFLLKGWNGNVVVKVNKASAFPKMFQKEANGLSALKSTQAIDVPEVLGYGDFKTRTYLMMEYKPSGQADQGFWELFGQQLADLHRNTQETFGFMEDNYIGSLPQYNGSAASASEFYIEQRLEPQVKMAKDNGYEFENIESFYQKLEEMIPDETPSLIHGDLWSGNYLVNSEGKPCLIDPAVAYAPREMDLAMMKLFGGFDDKLFQAYDESFPFEKDWEKRIALWQLYHILVHVNLFGGHYYQRAKDVLGCYL
ncbi:fructosamine kinase family protein [Psychroflexus sp. YR1-1]|uniref:Fructosamine kinase family protein n=1 Tax=Psychroflexus aurantiacus TaxID=2709310 RepID=A0A6B3RB13_9FLAO|nr:fructosamine kinase family protein [Psychroflexus aurantiacus]